MSSWQPRHCLRVLTALGLKIQTQERLKITLFTGTKRNLHIFGLKSWVRLVNRDKWFAFTIVSWYVLSSSVHLPKVILLACKHWLICSENWRWNPERVPNPVIRTTMQLSANHQIWYWLHFSLSRNACYGDLAGYVLRDNESCNNKRPWQRRRRDPVSCRHDDLVSVPQILIGGFKPLRSPSGLGSGLGKKVDFKWCLPFIRFCITYLGFGEKQF